MLHLLIDRLNNRLDTLSGTEYDVYTLLCGYDHYLSAQHTYQPKEHFLRAFPDTAGAKELFEHFENQTQQELSEQVINWVGQLYCVET